MGYSADKKYNFSKVKNHLQTLPNTNEKIVYLIERKAEFNQQYPYRYGLSSQLVDREFEMQCDIEIESLKKIASVQNEVNNQETKPLQSNFVLSETLSKIDYIRIINALSELRCFKKEDGIYPTKKEVMHAFGSLVNIDLSNYDKDLNKAFSTNVSLV